ncbi:MAG TPA: hypothetical protein VD993_03835 [Chitinophagaceae bacterium]|nr:hypothetical protein [Chitinophagaceae bacterium]
MTAALRKLMLTTHITFSVGWFGAVAVFLVLSVTGFTSQNPQIVRAMYIAMGSSTWFVILPACLGALLSGLIQSLVTPWGLFKHYWIVVKLLLTILSTLLLLMHMQPISYLADVASATFISDTDLRDLRIQLIGDAAAALFVLLIIITISVYKPWGKIQYGLKEKESQDEITIDKKSVKRKPFGLYILLGIIFLMLLVGLLHLFGIGIGGH